MGCYVHFIAKNFIESVLYGNIQPLLHFAQEILPKNAPFTSLAVSYFQNVVLQHTRG